VNRARAINICFHGIGEPARQLEPGESRYWITRDQYLRVLDEVAPWPGLSLSFDDGNQSDIEYGLPGLQERGLRATFFVLAGRLGQPGSLSAADVAALVAAGMDVGSHGMDHRPWRGMDDTTTRRELVQARAEIAEAAGVEIQAAACPLGRYDRGLLLRLRELGYQRVFTSDRRQARPSSWLQPRFSVRSEDSAQTLRAAALRPPDPLSRLRLASVGTLKRLR
jgi:peptidoglycan/xylan/chitin deacetylase (PgdA/CDA1 family)